MYSDGSAVQITTRSLIPVSTDPERDVLPEGAGGVKDRFEISKPKFGQRVMKSVLYLKASTALCVYGALNNMFRQNFNGITDGVKDAESEWQLIDANAPVGMPAKVKS